MKFAKFWGKGEAGGTIAWRWSDLSQEVANREAKAAAETLLQKFKSGILTRNKGDQYAYGVGPLREEVIETLPLRGEAGQSILTRNAYGALILNTDRIMFVDIDKPKKAASPFAFLGSLFQKSAAKETSDDEQMLSTLREYITQNRRAAFRVYKTFGGYRLLFHTDFHDPLSVASENIFQALKADPLYRLLCRRQASFRARLTPKPWRVDYVRPPCRWPIVYSKPQAQERQIERYKKWLEEYTKASGGFASCKFLMTLGNPEIHPDIKPVVDLHDRHSLAASSLPLA